MEPTTPTKKTVSFDVAGRVLDNAYKTGPEAFKPTTMAFAMVKAALNG